MANLGDAMQKQVDAGGTTLLTRFMGELRAHAEYTETLESENRNLREAMGKKNQEIVDLHTRLRAQDAENRDMNAHIAKLDAENRRVQDLLSQAERDNKDYENIICDLKGKFVALRAQSEVMTICQVENVHLKKEIETLKEQIFSLEKKLEESLWKNQGLTEAFFKAEKRAVDAETDYGHPADSAKACEKRQKIIEEMRKSGQEFAEKRLMKKVSSAARMIAHYKRKCEDLEVEKNGLLSIVDSITAIIRQVETEPSTGSDEIHRLMSRQIAYIEQMMQEHVRDLSLRNVDLEQALEKTREELSKVQNNYDDLHRDYYCKQASVKALGTEMKRREAQQKQEFNKYVATLHELDNIRKSFSQLKVELERCRVELAQTICVKNQLDSSLKAAHMDNLAYREKINNILGTLMGEKNS